MWRKLSETLFSTLRNMTILSNSKHWWFFYLIQISETEIRRVKAIICIISEILHCLLIAYFCWLIVIYMRTYNHFLCFLFMHSQVFRTFGLMPIDATLRCFYVLCFLLQSCNVQEGMKPCFWLKRLCLLIPCLLCYPVQFSGWGRAKYPECLICIFSWPEGHAWSKYFEL